MKVYLVTTRASLEENQRIKVEVENLGHEFKLFDFMKFDYGIRDGKLKTDSSLEEDLPDVLILRGIFNDIKSISSYVEGLRKKRVRVFDNNFLKHKYSINKISDLIKLTNAKISVPDSFHVHEFSKYVSCAKEIGYPVIVKMTRTGKGAGVYKIENESELKNFISDLEGRESEARNFIIQKFIPYELDLRILIIGSRIFCMRRIPKEREFRANFSLGGSVEKYELDNTGCGLAMKALKAVDLEVGGVDMLITKDNKRYILEVNHTSGMIGMELALSENITKVFVEYAISNAK